MNQEVLEGGGEGEEVLWEPGRGGWRAPLGPPSQARVGAVPGVVMGMNVRQQRRAEK